MDAIAPGTGDEDAIAPAVYRDSPLPWWTTAKGRVDAIAPAEDIRVSRSFLERERE